MGRILVGKLAIGNEEFGLKISAVAEGMEMNQPVVLAGVIFFLQCPLDRVDRGLTVQDLRQFRRLGNIHAAIPGYVVLQSTTGFS